MAEQEQQHEQEQDNRTRNLQGAIEDLEKEILEARAAQQGDEADDIVPWVIEFRVVGTPEIIRAPVSETLLFGRMDDAHEVYPEVDLGPHNGQQLGVSRRHARMIARDNRVTLEDLGSSNGTYINGQQLPVRRPQRVREGDIVQFGNLKMQVHFVVKPSVDDSTMHGMGNEVRISQIAQGQRLLVLDDNKDVLQVLQFVSKRAGFEPIIVNSLQDAIHTIDESPVDGVIVEVMLADSNGLDFVQYVRQNIQGKILPIIAIGSAAGGFSEGQALQRGADLYISKPIAIDELMRGLTKMVEMIAKT